ARHLLYREALRPQAVGIDQVPGLVVGHQSNTLPAAHVMTGQTSQRGGLSCAQEAADHDETKRLHERTPENTIGLTGLLPCCMRLHRRALATAVQARFVPVWLNRLIFKKIFGIFLHRPLSVVFWQSLHEEVLAVGRRRGRYPWGVLSTVPPGGMGDA